MPHKYPAVLTSEEAERIDLAIEAYRAVLVQAFVSAREWERQVGQLSATLNNERKAHETTRARADRLQKIYDAFVIETECTICDSTQPCICDGEAFICADRAACRTRAQDVDNPLAE